MTARSARAATPPAAPPATTSTVVNLETLNGHTRPFDLATMRSLDRSQRDWSPGVDIVGLFVPVDGGAPIAHTFSHWRDANGNVRGDRYFEPDSVMLTALRVRFNEPLLVVGRPRSKTQTRS